MSFVSETASFAAKTAKVVSTGLMSVGNAGAKFRFRRSKAGNFRPWSNLRTHVQHVDSERVNLGAGIMIGQ